MQDRSENSAGKKSEEIIKLAKLGMVFSRNILLAQPPRKTRTHTRILNITPDHTSL